MADKSYEKEIEEQEAPLKESQPSEVEDWLEDILVKDFENTWNEHIQPKASPFGTPEDKERCHKDDCVSYLKDYGSRLLERTFLHIFGIVNESYISGGALDWVMGDPNNRWLELDAAKQNVDEFESVFYHDVRRLPQVKLIERAQNIGIFTKGDGERLLFDYSNKKLDIINLAIKLSELCFELAILKKVTINKLNEEHNEELKNESTTNTKQEGSAAKE